MAFLDPDNNVTCRGKVYTKPKFFTTREGTEFKCSFILKVMRKHMSKTKEGKDYVGFDLIPVDYTGSDRMAWCHQNLCQGREVSAIGPLESSYRDEKFQIVVNAHTVVNVADYEGNPSITPSAGKVIQKELPFA